MNPSRNEAAQKDPLPIPMTEPAASSSKAQRSVARAAADLRRGLAVTVGDAAGGVALGYAAENLSPAALEALRALAADDDGLAARLALTAQRARVLHIAPRSPVVTIDLEARFDAAQLATLADPSADLDHPLRGPFGLDYEAPPGAVQSLVGLCKLARLLPAAVVVSGAAAAATRLADWARAEDVLWTQAAEIDAFPAAEAAALAIVSSARVPLADAEQSRIVAFRPADGGVEHLAIIIGDPPRHEPVLTRLHSECFTGDLLGSLKCDCGDQLRGAIAEMAARGGGVLCYLAQEGRGIGLINKLRAYGLQDQGFDTVEANERLGFEPDERIFQPAAEMLRQLGFSQVRLMTNNPDKVAGLGENGIEVVERVSHKFPANAHNEHYLATKRRRSGHFL